MEEYIDKRVKAIEIKCIKNADKFVKMFSGIKLNIDNREWIRQEDAVKGEEFIDDIPNNLIMHDTYFKKVYERDLEFKGPTYLKNYIANRAVEKITPEIIEEINNIREEKEVGRQEILELIKLLAQQTLDNSQLLGDALKVLLPKKESEVKRETVKTKPTYIR